MKISKLFLAGIIIFFVALTISSCNEENITRIDTNIKVLETNEFIMLNQTETLHQHFSSYIYTSAAKMLEVETNTTANLWYEMRFALYPYYNVEIINPLSFEYKSSIENNSLKVIICDLKIDSLEEQFIIIKDNNNILGLFSDDWTFAHNDNNLDSYRFSKSWQMTEYGITKQNLSSNLYIDVSLIAGEPANITFYDNLSTSPTIEGEIIPSSYKIKEISEVFALINSGELKSVTFDVCVQENQYDMLIVKSEEGYNLKYMYYYKNKVKITKDGVNVSIYDIKTGTKLRVSYNLRNASYNPDELYFNKFIVLNEEIEVNEVLVKVKEVGHTIKIESLVDYNIDYFRYDDNTEVYKNGVVASITDIKVGSIIKVNIPKCCDTTYPKNIYIDKFEIISQ